MDAIQDRLKFVGGKFVRGGDDTVKLFNEGKLQPILKEASGVYFCSSFTLCSRLLCYKYKFFHNVKSASSKIEHVTF
jgi:hypothetical protein